VIDFVIEVDADGNFGPDEMRSFLRRIEASDWACRRPDPIQNMMDQLAIDCLHEDRPDLGVALCWLSVLVALGRLPELMQAMVHLIRTRPSLVCRVCGYTEDPRRGRLLVEGAEPRAWFDRDTCAACAAAGGPPP
jgi:hypothetical protein